MSKKLPKEVSIEDRMYEIAIEMRNVGWQNFLYRAKYLEDNPLLVEKAEDLAKKFSFLCDLKKEKNTEGS